MQPTKPTWESFKDTNLTLNSQFDWKQCPVPGELHEDGNITALPEKIKQILAWSLNFDHVPDSTTMAPSLLQQETIAYRVPENNSETVAEIDPQSTSPSVNHEHRSNNHISDSCTSDPRIDISHSQSILPGYYTAGSSQGRLVKARKIGSSVFSSTLDLFATLKTRSGREASPGSDIDVAYRVSQAVVECTSCLEDVLATKTNRLPCSHYYCKLCLTTLITTSLENESSFPPKCCLTAIPLQTVLAALDAKQRLTYQAKAAEFSIPPQERHYCPNKKCLKWIRPSKPSRTRTAIERCPHCATKICIICRGTAHKSTSDCPQDFGTEAVVTLAEEEGWRRCITCRAMIERTQGCRHITCKCGAEFCYTCGARWRTCRCTEDDELNRQAALRRRRGEQESEMDAEAAMIARIMAQIEELERETARARQQEEERLAERQREEEAELASLEELRLREEEEKREEEARLQEELRQTLRISIEENCDALQAAWDVVQQLQRERLASRHLHAQQQSTQERDEALAAQTQENETTYHAMERNSEETISTTKEKHSAELASFTKEQQDLEDDMFLEMHLRLRGSQDKEARKLRLQQRFQEQSQRQHNELLTRHSLEVGSLQTDAEMEWQGLELNNAGKLANVELNFYQRMKTLSASATADRAWYDFLSQRRQNMVDADRRLMLEALEADSEPVGLTEDVAATIGPFPAVSSPETQSVDAKRSIQSCPGLSRRRAVSRRGGSQMPRAHEHARDSWPLTSSQANVSSDDRNEDWPLQHRLPEIRLSYPPQPTSFKNAEQDTRQKNRNRVARDFVPESTRWDAGGNNAYLHCLISAAARPASMVSSLAPVSPISP